MAIKNSTFISYEQNMVIDYSKLEILDVEKPYFWQHHGHTESDKELLREEAKALPTALEKSTH